MIVHDLCAAAVTAHLLARGGAVDAIVAPGAAGRRAWGARAESVGRHCVDPAWLRRSPAAGELVQAVYVAPRPPAELADPVWQTTTRLGLEVWTDDLRCGDPLFWAVLTESPELRIGLRLTDGDEADPGSRGLFGSVAVPPQCDYEQAAAIVAEFAAVSLDRLDTQPVDRHPPRPERTLLTPTPAWTRVDWTSSPAAITALVRACATPGNGAWTRLDGIRVEVHRAEVASSTPHRWTPGTVLDNPPEGLLVAAGGGLVQLTDVSDVLGRIESSSVAPGTVLGADLHDELVELRRRVRDLECLVRRLSPAADIL